MLEKKGGDAITSFQSYAEFIIGAIEFEIDVIRLQITNGIEQKTPLCNNTLSPYYWKSNKSDLVEVIESLILIGGINDGIVNKNELYDFVGTMLNIDLSNHSRILNHISERKDYCDKLDSRVHYLPQLVKILSNRLEVLEQERLSRR